MRATWALAVLGALTLTVGSVGGGCSSEESPTSSSSGTSGTGPTPTTTGTTPVPTDTTKPPPPDPPIGAAPRAVKVAKATAIPGCTVHVDAANASAGDGSAGNPFKTIAAGITAAAAGGVVCVAQGTYAEKLTTGAKYLTLAGGFQTGKTFKVRDSSAYPSKGQGDGTGAFLRISDPAPSGTQLTVIDGFEITGYEQGIVRDVFYAQKLDITNNYIHDNACSQTSMIGGAFFMNNVSGSIKGNVIKKNSCGRGGAGALIDGTAASTMNVEGNLVDGNSGTEPGIAHGGGFYFFTKILAITANEFVNNTATGWGGGLFVGGETGQGLVSTATMTWNVYRGNKAGIAGGGFFCDDGAVCKSDHEIYDRNCGGNIYLDCGPTGSNPTLASFDHLTNVNALAVGCGGPGNGVQIDKDNTAADVYSFTNALFSGNAAGKDFVTGCVSGCGTVKVDVKYSNVQTTFQNGGVGITFGAGIVTPVDPLFVDSANGDLHLKSKNGHWAGTTYVRDTVDSPALKAGDPASAVSGAPPRAGDRTELGAYGNSPEASLVR